MNRFIETSLILDRAITAELSDLPLLPLAMKRALFGIHAHACALRTEHVDPLLIVPLRGYEYLTSLVWSRGDRRVYEDEAVGNSAAASHVGV